MNKTWTFLAAAAATAALALPMAHAASMTKAEQATSKSRIGEVYKADKAACAQFTANTRDVCMEGAKAKEKVALAELQFAYTGKSGDGDKLRTARAESAYAVAKERCDDQSGNARDVCVKEAKAVEVKSLADAKMGREIVDAKKDASAEKREADLKVALEKCDALAGDAKTRCVDAAKATLGKT